MTFRIRTALLAFTIGLITASASAEQLDQKYPTAETKKDQTVTIIRGNKIGEVDISNDKDKPVVLRGSR